MSYSTTSHLYSPFFPPGHVPTKTSRKRAYGHNAEEPPEKPDWLMIFMGILFLLTLLLLWMVDIPRLLN